MKQFSFALLLLLFTVGCNTIAQNNQNITTKELKVLIEKNNDIQIIDVRTPEEIKEGFIPNAKFVNFYDANFKSKLDKIVDKNKTVYLYCRTGNRSGQASELLTKEGYKAVNVIGGYNKWKSENKEK